MYPPLRGSGYTAPEYRGKPECPRDCHFFVDRQETDRARKFAELQEQQKQRRERKKKLGLKILALIPAPFNWFAKLPWQTQILIILGLILLFAPTWTTSIAELIKTLK